MNTIAMSNLPSAEPTVRLLADGSTCLRRQGTIFDVDDLVGHCPGRNFVCGARITGRWLTTVCDCVAPCAVG